MRTNTILSEKKNISIILWKEVDNPKLEARKIAKRLVIPYSCLIEWKYIDATTIKKINFRLEAGGILPEIVNIKEYLIIWICEQKSC